MSQEITFVMAAGQTKRVNVNGNYYRIIESSGIVWVGVDGALEVKRQQGMAEEFASGFETIELRSVVAQTVVIVVTGGDLVHDNRLNVLGSLTVSGVVQVSDENKTNAKNQYLTGVSVVATPGNNTQFQLWNPAGSGVNIVINNIYYRMKPVGGNVVIFVNISAVKLPDVINYLILNKYAGGPAAKAEVYQELGSNAPLVGTRMPSEPTVIGALPLGNAPVVLPEGWGFSIASDADDSIYASIDFEEIAI